MARLALLLVPLVLLSGCDWSGDQANRRHESRAIKRNGRLEGLLTGACGEGHVYAVVPDDSADYMRYIVTCDDGVVRVVQP